MRISNNCLKIAAILSLIVDNFFLISWIYLNLVSYQSRTFSLWILALSLNLNIWNTIISNLMCIQTRFEYLYYINNFFHYVCGDFLENNKYNCLYTTCLLQSLNVAYIFISNTLLHWHTAMFSLRIKILYIIQIYYFH